jgi:hypothetical protein
LDRLPRDGGWFGLASWSPSRRSARTCSASSASPSSFKPRRLLGLFPSAAITLRDPRALSRLTASVARTLHGGQPAERVDRRDAALVALAAAGELPVLPRRQRRRHRRRITRLTERGGSAAPAFHRVVQLVKGSAAG